MRVARPSVEGVEMVNVIRAASEKIRTLEGNQWNFSAVPEVFAKDPYADVLAKELVHIHDGQTMTRIGRLYMGGTGRHFNLMGPIPPDAIFRVGATDALEQVNVQLKSRGLRDLKEFRALGKAQPVEFFNYTLFYTLRDLVFWSLVHDAGVFPSGLEIMARHFAAGNVVQNSLYSPKTPSQNKRAPALMVSGCLMLQFPSTVVEWMDKPIYGGLARETIHVESLLTLKPSSVSHPYLPLVRESKVTLRGKRYYARRFAGITPKDGVRGPGVPAEAAARL